MHTDQTKSVIDLRLEKKLTRSQYWTISEGNRTGLDTYSEGMTTTLPNKH